MIPKSGLDIGDADINPALLQHLLRFFGSVLLESALLITAGRCYGIVAAFYPVFSSAAKIRLFSKRALARFFVGGAIFVVDLCRLLQHQFWIVHVSVKFVSAHIF